MGSIELSAKYNLGIPPNNDRPNCSPIVVRQQTREDLLLSQIFTIHHTNIRGPGLPPNAHKPYHQYKYVKLYKCRYVYRQIQNTKQISIDIKKRENVQIGGKFLPINRQMSAVFSSISFPFAPLTLLFS